MKEPKTIDQDRDLLETYQSLREEVKGARVRSVETTARRLRNRSKTSRVWPGYKNKSRKEN
ncbi:hypothetical protein DPMN_164699 [Dreissena polymorpha]|uniref:Uncharacterized protein n=1 Tax=Dreissena polymorpha TaxID=45954 RepID=A0A9D4IVV8_DREPO|nr:hypothetical protein DPMN_164699 [Dreissena polymorpha]